MASDESQVAVQVGRLLDRTEEEWLIERLRAAETAFMYALPMIEADMERLEQIARLRATRTRPDGTPRKLSQATLDEQQRLNERLAGLAELVTQMREMGSR